MANIALDTPITSSSAASARAEAAPVIAPVRVCLPVRTAALSIVGFWFFYFVMNTIRMAVEEAHGQVGMIERRVAVSLIGTLLTSLLWLLLRRFEGRSTRTLVTVAFLASLPVSFAYAAVNFAAFYVVHPHEEDLEELHKEGMGKTLPEVYHIADSALTWYFFIVAWAILYIALSYAGKVRVAERNAALYRAEAQSAQLRAFALSNQSAFSVQYAELALDPGAARARRRGRADDHQPVEFLSHQPDRRPD